MLLTPGEPLLHTTLHLTETCNHRPESHKLEEKDLLSKEAVKQPFGHTNT